MCKYLESTNIKHVVDSGRLLMWLLEFMRFAVANYLCLCNEQLVFAFRPNSKATPLRNFRNFGVDIFKQSGD